MRTYLVLFLTVFSVLTMGLIASISLPVAAVSDITAPTWEEGNSWSMGFYEEMDENDLLGSDGADYSEISMFSEFGSIRYDASMGFYQTFTVMDTDDTSTGVTAYKVKVEQYLGALMEIDVDIHMDQNDIPSYGEEVPNFQIDMVANGYFWLEMDNIGHIYFTVEDLAIAREEFKITANADMDFYAKMNYDMQADANSDAGNYGDLFENVEMDMAMSITDMVIDYQIDFEPALDVFDFPIESYESWSASSDMTITLNDLDGTVKYDMSGNIPGEEFTPESGSVNMGEELTLPDVYGPESMAYYFENLGPADNVIGDYEDAIIIAGDDEGYFNYNDYYYTRGTGEVIDEQVTSIDDESDSPLDIVDDIKDFDAHNLVDFNPVNMFILGSGYYSPSAGMVVSKDMGDISEALPGGMGDTPFGLMEGATESADLKMEPVSKSDVAQFKDSQRPALEQQYEDVKAGDTDDSSNLMLWLIIAAVAVVVVLVIAALLVTKKKKGQDQYPGYPPQQGQPYAQQYPQQPPAPQPTPVPVPAPGQYPPPPPPPMPPQY